METHWVWNVDPILVTLGPFTVRWYGALFALGVFCAFLLFQWFYRREGKPVEEAGSVLNHVIVGIILGARLGHCLFYEPETYLAEPWRILKIWEGGLASHGALLGGLVAVWVYIRKKGSQTSFWWITDRAVVGGLLAGAFIRLGNLMNSEIIGRPSDLPWALVFSRWDGVPRHPTQIYEAIYYFLAVGFIVWIYKKLGERAQVPGFLFGLFLTFTFVFRFSIEFLKENQVAFESDLPLNMGQLLSVPGFLLGIYFVRKAIKSPPVQPTHGSKKKRK